MADTTDNNCKNCVAPIKINVADAYELQALEKLVRVNLIAFRIKAELDSNPIEKPKDG